MVPASITPAYEDVAKVPRVTLKVTLTARRVTQFSAGVFGAVREVPNAKLPGRQVLGFRGRPPMPTPSPSPAPAPADNPLERPGREQPATEERRYPEKQREPK